jgi:hypothetical protein
MNDSFMGDDHGMVISSAGYNNMPEIFVAAFFAEKGGLISFVIKPIGAPLINISRTRQQHAPQRGCCDAHSMVAVGTLIAERPPHDPGVRR